MADEPGRVQVDQDSPRAFVGDREVELTPLEFRLLTVFLQRPVECCGTIPAVTDFFGDNVNHTTQSISTI